MSDDYLATFNEFWREIVTDDSGQLDLDKVARELHDYHLVMGEVGKAYDELTGGRLSKPNTAAHHVIEQANDVAEDWYARLLCEKADDLHWDVNASLALREVAEEWRPGVWEQWQQTKAARARLAEQRTEG